MTDPAASARAYLLDTNVVSDLVRRPQGRITHHVARVGESHVCTSMVVAAELRFGALKSGSRRLCNQVDAVLARMRILPWDAPADRHYAELRTALERAGQPIGPNDMLIAAHARALGCILVTANMREFSRVPELRVESWLFDA